MAEIRVMRADGPPERTNFDVPPVQPFPANVTGETVIPSIGNDTTFGGWYFAFANSARTLSGSGRDATDARLSISNLAVIKP